MNTDVETDLRFQDHATLCRVTFDFSTPKNNKDAAIPSKRIIYKENVQENENVDKYASRKMFPFDYT